MGSEVHISQAARRLGVSVTMLRRLEREGKIPVDAEGWDFVDRPPVLFRHFPNLKPLPDPERGGSLGVLDGLVNLKTERDRRHFKAYLTTVPLPHVGRPILNASGAMWSGKTTAGRIVKRTWDPTALETVRADPRDFLQKASHAYIVMLDNQNTIPEWAADTLCRLVTGEADSKRRLYTDDEDVIIELRRAVLLNGINVPTDRGDVLDRSLVVELERIPDGERRTEEELWERFEAEHPKLLGGLFHVLTQAIALKPSPRLSQRPRLADWGEYAAAVYEVMGWGAETFLKDWDEVVKVQNQATLDGSPVAQAIIKFMKAKDEYVGTSSELHGKLKVEAATLGVAVERDKAWPKSAGWLWRRIKEVLPLLVAAGIEAHRAEDRFGSKITLRKSPEDDATNATADENRGGTPKTDGNNHKSNATDAGSNATGGNTVDLDATCNTTECPLTYANSARGGNSGIRDGDSSGDGSPDHNEQLLGRSGRYSADNHNPHEHDIEDEHDDYGAAPVMAPEDAAAEKPWPYHEAGCPCAECASRWPPSATKESNIETESSSAPWYTHPLDCTCFECEKYG
jgi:hypothetical protein